MSRHLSPDERDNDDRVEPQLARAFELTERHETTDDLRSSRDDPTRTFSRGLDIPHADERQPVESRGRTYFLRRSEADALATIGAFRVVPVNELTNGRESSNRTADVRHLASHGLIARHQVIVNDRPTTVCVLTREAKQLLEGHRAPAGRDRPQEFHAGLVKRREIAHDAQLYRLYRLEAGRIARNGGTVRRVVLDHELKRDYQTFLNRPDRPRDRRLEEDRAVFANQASLPIVDGHLELPDLRIEYETSEGLIAYRDVELVTEHYSRSQLAGKAAAGFGLYRAVGCRPNARQSRGATPLDPHHLDWLR